MKHLEIIFFLNPDCLIDCFINCKSLESLTIDFHWCKPLEMNSIKTILIANKGLKKLDLCNVPIFNEDILTKIGFELNEFNFTWDVAGILRTKFRKNINLFLKTQSDFLQSFSTERWMGFDVFRTILLMPRLKHLTLAGLKYIEPAKFAAENLPQNHSVTSLYYRNSKHRDEMTENILKLFPKVETLKLYLFTQRNFNLINKNCKFLKHFSFHE